MSHDPASPRHDPIAPANASVGDEGGLHAPPGLGFWRTVWWWFDFLILLKLARLRFIVILAAIGLVIIKWDTLTAYYERFTHQAPLERTDDGDTEYSCPMHPAVIRDNNKEKCPICFMALAKRKKTMPEALPPGIANRVQFSPYRIVLGGIKTSAVANVPLSREIVTVGFVEFNERGMKQVSARVKGRIDTLIVNETGQMVHAGDELASLYSPDLVSTMRDLLNAKEIGNQDLMRIAGERLSLWGISKTQIDETLKTGKANTHLKITSPIAGHVIKKYVKEGQYVEEGTPLYDIVDLTSVWIQALVYEDDMALLPAFHQPLTAEEADKNGLPVIATTRAFPTQPFEGKLTFVLPHVDQETRSVVARFTVANRDDKLRPGSSATVRFTIQQGSLLAVPESAVIDTGTQQLVYRQIDSGKFEGVLVRLGPRMKGAGGDNFYPVLSGLKAGDHVVTAGSFLVDAETRLNPAAGSIYFGGSGSKTGQGNVNVRPSTPEEAKK